MMKCEKCHDGEYLEAQRNEIGKLRDEIHNLRVVMKGQHTALTDALKNMARLDAELARWRPQPCDDHIAEAEKYYRERDEEA